MPRSYVAELTTERAEALDDTGILSVEHRLLALANAIAAQVFSTRGWSRPRRKGDRSRVIYEVTPRDALHIRRGRRAYERHPPFDSCARTKAKSLSASTFDTDPPCLPPIERLDAFANKVTSLRIEQPHHALTITAKSQVRVTRPPPSDFLVAVGKRGIRSAHHRVAFIRLPGDRTVPFHDA